MVHSVRHEWLDLWTAYLKWRYAFPDRPNPILEALEASLSDGLGTALADRPAVVLRHPYPPHIPALADALLDHFGRTVRLGDVAHRFLAKRPIRKPPKVTSHGQIRTLASPRHPVDRTICA